NGPTTPFEDLRRGMADLVAPDACDFAVVRLVSVGGELVQDLAGVGPRRLGTRRAPDVDERYGLDEDPAARFRSELLVAARKRLPLVSFRPFLRLAASLFGLAAGGGGRRPARRRPRTRSRTPLIIEEEPPCGYASASLTLPPRPRCRSRRGSPPTR